MTSLNGFSKEMLEHFLESLWAWFPMLGASLLIFFLFYIASIITKALICRFIRQPDSQRAQVIELLGTTAKVTVILIGLITSLGSMGVNVSALVAGLGLSGFALSFALKDALSNILAGMMIFIYQPFKVGQTISLAGNEGKVTALTLRFITLKSEGKRVLIPNASMLTNNITIMDQK